MNTRHGHHIPGTVKDNDRPKFVKRCGGVNHCKQCTAEWEKVFEMQKKPEFVGEVPLKDKPGGNVIGTAKLEKLPGGNVVAHLMISDSDKLAALVEGFSFGSFSVSDDE